MPSAKPSPPTAGGNALAVLGLDPVTETTYRAVIRHAGALQSTVATALGVPVEELPEVLASLIELDLVQLGGDFVEAAPPDVALGRLLAAEVKRYRETGDQLHALRELMPVLRREHVAERGPAGDRIAGDVIAGGDIVRLWRDLAQESDGEILQFRSDQWRLPTSPAMDALAAELLAAGRAFRSLYPAIALTEAHDVLRNRTAEGEQIRMVAHLPARIVVFGTTAAMVPQDWGINNERRVVVRQPALVAALGFLFEQMWERGVVVPGMPGGEWSPAAARTLLLDRMSRGEKDEQIARALGVSLRTVRRRIADLQEQLGVSSRFQTGVEAVRRGWL
jgi:hypothetical protein